MNETKTSCAPADSRNLTWDGMDWSKCEAYVRKLQARIVKAQKEGRHNKVKALQWMLTHSFYAKALAVKRLSLIHIWGGRVMPYIPVKMALHWCKMPF